MNLEEALALVNKNMENGWWAPLKEPARALVREHYLANLDLPLGNSDLEIKNAGGTLISNGYERIVIGDYGPYVEFNTSQAAMSNLKSKYPGKPNRPVKYLWLETNDRLKTKVYYQQDVVKYADYKIGMLYVSPADIVNK